MTKHNITLADLEGLGLEDFDPAEYITSDEAAAAYLSEALAANDAAIFASAVGVVARARGMAEIARLSGLAREGLYKALRPDSQPRMETLIRVLAALGVRLKAEVIPAGERPSSPFNYQTKEARVTAKPTKPKPLAVVAKPAATKAAAKPRAKPTIAKLMSKSTAKKPRATPA